MHSHDYWVYLFADDDPVTSCSDEPSFVAGCWKPPTAYSSWDALSHELVHAVSAIEQEHPNSVLAEGLAEALSGSVMVSLSAESRASMRDRLGAAIDLSSSGYQSAGHFVRWLVNEFGFSAVWKFYTSASPQNASWDVGDAVEEAFGISEGVLFDRYESESREFYPGLGPFRCGSGEQLQWSSGVGWKGELLCADERSVTRINADGSAEIWRRWSVAIPADGVYRVSVSGGGGSITRCLEEPLDEAELPDFPASPIAVDWIAGQAPLYRPGGGGVNVLVGQQLLLEAGSYDLWVARKGDDENKLVEVSILE
ncbi:MAG: hypothetical protein R3E95_24830 [Thiolinea sp.]